MAGRSKSPGNLVQTGIINFIHKKTSETSSPNSANKRPLSSPDTNISPTKRTNMVTMENHTVSNETKPKIQLPPELQLLYESLSDKIDKIDKKIPDDFNLPKHAREVEEIKVQQVKLKSRLSRVERENESLKQKITLMKDKMLEHNIVITGISEDKWEDLEPRKGKVCKVLASLMERDNQKEKLEKANELDIMHTECLGRFNPQKGWPISVRFVHKQDVDMVLTNKKKLTKGVFVDQQYSDETEMERRRLRPVLCAARHLEE